MIALTAKEVTELPCVMVVVKVWTFCTSADSAPSLTKMFILL